MNTHVTSDDDALSWAGHAAPPVDHSFVRLSAVSLLQCWAWNVLINAFAECCMHACCMNGPVGSILLAARADSVGA